MTTLTMPRRWRLAELLEARCSEHGTRLYRDRGRQWCPDCTHRALEGYKGRGEL